MKKTIALLVSGLLAITMVTGCAGGDAKYPQKPVEVIVPFGAGGGADISVRILSKYAEKHLGQRIIVNNVTGGSGTIGFTQLSKAKPDGYTIGYFGNTTSNDKLLFEGIEYEADSFAPILHYAADPHIIVASKKSGITSLEELVEAAKANPGTISYGVGGAWTSHDFLRIALEKETGIELNRMVYQGGAEANNAVAGGDCDIAVPFVSEALAQIDAGNVVPLAITSDKRYELTPDIPTAIESGINFTHTMWRGIVAPKGTPEEVIKTIEDAYKKAYDDPAYQEEALKVGVFSSYKGGEDFKTFYLKNHEEIKETVESQGK